jgi:outer membrane protein TolC
VRAPALAVFVLVSTARALAAPPLSLAEAQAEARAHAPEGAALEARLRAEQLAAAPASRALRTNPTVSGTYAPGVLTGHPDEHSWEIALSQTLDLSGSWRPHGASAAADRDRAAEEREEGLRSLDEAVAIAFADAAHGQRGVGRSERLLRLQEIASDAARRQLELGEGNQLDADAADLALAAARADVARASGGLAAARIRLARLLGRAGHADLAVEEALADGRAALAAPPEAAVEAAPRVRAADAELRAARLELAAHERSAWPELTVGAFYAHSRRDIPAGSFRGPAGGGLSASWTDDEIGLRLEAPLGLFDRRDAERARASGRVLLAEAEQLRARADVRQELEQARAALAAAQEALEAVVRTPDIVARELELLERSFRAGALDAVARAVALRTLQDAGARYDAEVRELRVARAHWERWAGAAR